MEVVANFAEAHYSEAGFSENCFEDKRQEMRFSNLFGDVIAILLKNTAKKLINLF